KTPPWPQYNHDARRTSFANSPQFVGVGDGTSGPDRPVTALEFAPPAPNPARPSRTGTRMWFGVPANLAGQTYELAIYDLSGRRVPRVAAGLATAGRFSLAWDLRASRGRPVDGGVYFARFTLGKRSLTHKMVVLQ